MTEDGGCCACLPTARAPTARLRFTVSSRDQRERRSSSSQGSMALCYQQPKGDLGALGPSGGRDRVTRQLFDQGHRARGRRGCPRPQLPQQRPLLPSCPLTSAMVTKSEVHHLRELWTLRAANCVFIDAKLKKKKTQPVSAPRLSLPAP